MLVARPYVGWLDTAPLERLRNVGVDIVQTPFGRQLSETALRELHSVGTSTRYPQVMLTPHIGSWTVECGRRIEPEAVKNLLEALERAGDRI